MKISFKTEIVSLKLNYLDENIIKLNLKLDENIMKTTAEYKGTNQHRRKFSIRH